MSRVRPVCALLLIASTVLLAGVGRAEESLAGRYDTGTRLLDEGRWAEALPVYRRLAVELPDDGWCWMGLGWSLHYTGSFADAVPAYRRALALGGMPAGRVWLEVARCHAATGHPDSALDALDAALAAGLTRVHTLADDPRLKTLWPSPRFRAITGAVDRATLTRAEGWRHDLRLLEREIRRMYAVPLSPRTSVAVDSAIRATGLAVARESDDALAVRLMRLARLLGDGHTEAIAPFQEGPASRGLPVQFGAFADGVFVTGTDSAHAALLWRRVDAVEGRPVEEVLRRLDVVCPQDNPARPRSVAPQLLRYAPLLHALGLARRDDRVSLRLSDPTGAATDAEIAVRPGPPPAWIREPAGAAGPPEFVRRRFEYHWLRSDPARGEVFAAYNGCADADSESVAAFAERLGRALAEPGVRRLVLDLRWNGGGNNHLNRPLLEAIVQARTVNRPGRLFVITSPHTFSAAMCLAGELDLYTHAVFVGEPTGSSPNFVGETNFVPLPWSGVRVSISNLAWQNTTASDRRPWIPPRLPVPWRFADWRAGRDAALEAIRAWDAGP